MHEKLERVTYSDGVRGLSQRILDNSADILKVDFNAAEGNLLSSLVNLQNERKDNILFGNDELSPENELGLVLFLDVVNFCFQDPVTGGEYRYINKSGEIVKRSSGLRAAMAESGVNWGDFSDVSQITSQKWNEMTQLGPKNSLFLGLERGRRIVRFAEQLLHLGYLTPKGLIEDKDYDTEKFLKVLDESGFFEDEFMKRSQLAVNMMDGVLKRRFSAGFKGTESLTVMADYRLPQIMYNFCSIVLSPELMSRLMSSDVIEADSREEKALRAASVVIGKRLSDLMGINEGRVDSLLWTLARKMDSNNQLTIPHMIVATDKY